MMMNWRYGDTFLVGMIGRDANGNTFVHAAVEPIKLSEGNMIKIGDVVLHTLSNLHFLCENKKMERWMNMNPYYVKTDKNKKELINYANKNEQ